MISRKNTFVSLKHEMQTDSKRTLLQDCLEEFLRTNLIMIETCHPTPIDQSDNGILGRNQSDCS